MARKLLISINGFDVYEDSQFIVGDKKDEIYHGKIKKPGTKKYPGAEEGCAPTFVTNTPTSAEGRYDLGLAEHSVFHKFHSSTEKKERIRQIRENIIEPFCEDRGISFERFEYNNEFLESSQAKFSFRAGDIFIASNPTDLFKLYLLLLRKKVCPTDKQSSSEYKDSVFTIWDTVAKKTVQETQNSRKMELTATLYNKIEKKEYKSLLDTFKYIGVKCYLSENSDKTQFIEFVSDNIINSPTQNERMFESFSVPAIEIEIHALLAENFTKPNAKLTKKSNTFFWEDTELGTSLKNIAKDISKAKAEPYKTIRQELFIENVYEDLKNVPGSKATSGKK